MTGLSEQGSRHADHRVVTVDPDLGHEDSSAVVPDAATSGTGHTVEGAGGASRGFDSSTAGRVTEGGAER